MVIRNLQSRRQSGFMAGPLLIGIALIIAVVGFMAFANRGPATSTSSQQNKLNAALLLKQGSDLAEGYARAVGDGITPATLEFNATAPNGLFNPAKGYAVAQIVPTKVCVSTANNDCAWKENKSVVIEDIGSGTGDGLIAVNSLTAGTCEAINNALYNEAFSATGDGANVPEATLAGATVVAGTIGSNMGLTGTGAGRAEGCVKQGGIFTYYKVLNPL